MEASGRVITKYRSTAMTMSVIMEQMPNKAPQNAYTSQPGETGGPEFSESITKHSLYRIDISAVNSSSYVEQS